MKKNIAVFVLVLLLISISNAQWQPDVRLTNNGGISQTTFNHGKCIAASGDSLHLIFYDSRPGSFQVYYKRSLDGGTTWGADTRLSLGTPGGAFPSIAVSGSVIHAAWWDVRHGSNDEIYYKRSTDGGATWGVDTRISNDDASSFYPSVAVSGSVVHIAWLDNRHGNFEIYYSRSTDAGVTWGIETRLTNDDYSSVDPSISLSGQNVHIVWDDDRNSTGYEIYYKRSTDGGVTWGSDIRLSTLDSLSSVNSCVSVSGQLVCVVWEDERNGNQEIYYKGSTNGGSTWGADTRLTNNDSVSQYPTVEVSGQKIHVAWWDKRDGNYEIYYKSSSDGGATWEADLRLTNDPASSEYPSITVSGSAIHLVWQDLRVGGFNSEIFYKRNPTGNPIGIQVYNSEIPRTFSLSQNYPNPFNPATNINFSIPQSVYVSLKIYDMLGREIETLISQEITPGNYTINWNAQNKTSGIYLYKLIADGYFETKKMVLIK